MPNSQNGAPCIVIMLNGTHKCQVIVVVLGITEDKPTSFGCVGTLHMWILSCTIIKVELQLDLKQLMWSSVFSSYSVFDSLQSRVILFKHYRKTL